MQGKAKQSKASYGKIKLIHSLSEHSGINVMSIMAHLMKSNIIDVSPLNIH